MFPSYEHLQNIQVNGKTSRIERESLTWGEISKALIILLPGFVVLSRYPSWLKNFIYKVLSRHNKYSSLSYIQRASVSTRSDFLNFGNLWTLRVYSLVNGSFIFAKLLAKEGNRKVVSVWEVYIALMQQNLLLERII